LITFKGAKIKGVSLQNALASLFQDAELSYCALVQTATDPIISFEQDGKIIQWNSAAEAVFGYRQSKAVGSSLFDLVIDKIEIKMLWRYSMTIKYKVNICRTGEGFSVWVPGLPGCWSQGQTEIDALENIKDAIESYLETVEELTKRKKCAVLEKLSCANYYKQETSWLYAI
jgi:PAS domain S-box-containing protein